MNHVVMTLRVLPVGLAVALAAGAMPAAGQVQAAPTELDCARPEFAALRPFLGRWQVRASDRVAPGTFEETTGIAEVVPAAGGCVLLEHYEGVRRGRPYHTLTLISLTPEGVFEQLRLDSEHSRLTVSAGSMVGDTLIFEYARVLPDRTLRTWALYYGTAGRGLHVRRYLQRADDAERELTYDARYHRVP